MTAPDDGLDPRLSAYLDGELAEAEAAEVRRLLESSTLAREEYERVREARDLVRELPLLEPPADVAALFAAAGRGSPLSPRTHRRRARAGARAVVMSAVATAAFWGVAVSSPDITASVAPALDSAVAAHSVGPDAVNDGEPMGMDDTDMPSEVGGTMQLVRVERVGPSIHALYSDGVREMSVFEEPGRVAWTELPPGERIEVDGSPGWHGTVDGYDIVVLERGRRVYTIVAKAPPQEMMDDVGVSMPGDERGFIDRLREGSSDVIRVFGLRG
jgi:hypothetical protein